MVTDSDLVTWMNTVFSNSQDYQFQYIQSLDGLKSN